MLEHFEGGSPEDALAAFKAFREKAREEEFRAFKETASFLDLYHPVRQLRFYDWCLSLTDARVKHFISELKDGTYLALCLRRQGEKMAMTCPVNGHLEPPEFAFDASLGSIWITGLPESVSVWDVVDVVQDLEGFVTAAWRTTEVNRDFWARFASGKEAHAALLAMNKTEFLSSARVSLIEA